MAIVGLTAVAALAAAGAEIRTATRAHHLLEAQALAVYRMSSIELLRGDDIEFLPDSLSNGAFDPPFDSYKWKAESEPILGEPGLTEVAVEVLWPSGSYKLRTRLYRRPVVLGTL
jgi:hypothetical protein